LINLQMTAPGSKEIFFIINPISGTKEKSRIETLIRERYDRQDQPVRIEYTQSVGHARELAQRAVEEGYRKVVVVGGDGTVNEAGQSLIGTDTMLGIIPTGSGNGLARHLKIPRDSSKALAVAEAEKFLAIDTATINDNVFLSIAGVGYDAHVAKKFAKSPKRGFFSYFRIVSQEYKGYKPRKYSMMIDGKPVTRKALMVSFANSSQFGNNTSIDPAACIDDGYIDVCIVRRIPTLLIPFYVPLLFLKTFHKTHFIEIIRAKEVVLQRKKGKAVNIDGEWHREGTELHVKVLPKSLKILIP
jgi:diacylglycerol kinase (ATP)